MNKYIVWFLIILFFYLILYFITNRKNKYSNFIESKKNKNISVLTYNVKRLPYCLKKLDYNDWDYDIICFQEFFNNIFFKKANTLKNTFNYNYLSPESNFNYLADSGLVVMSKYPIKYIGFEKFNHMASVDRFSQKGFMIVKIRKLIVINTHLQSCYNNNKYHKKIQYLQLEQIYNYIINNIISDEYNDTNILLVGDFNVNIFNINIFKNFKKIYHKSPTLWDDDNGIISNTSTSKINNEQTPKWYDGGFLLSNKYSIRNIQTECLDEYTDHLGLSFILNKKIDINKNTL